MSDPGKFPWYSRSGDGGDTSLLGNRRVPKHHPQPETYGTIDEATSFLGLARAAAIHSETREIILTVQRQLYRIMSEVAATPDSAADYRYASQDQLTWLESTIDGISDDLEMPKEFVVPGNSLPGAALDMARATVRRAERRVIALAAEGLISNPFVVKYLNRLSSLCYVLARYEDSALGPVTLAKSADNI